LRARGRRWRWTGQSLNGSLTCLSWLQKLGCTSGLQQPLATVPNPVIKFFCHKEQPAKKKSTPKTAKKSSSGSSKQGQGHSVKQEKLCTQQESLAQMQMENAAIHWSTNSTEKPPHCYATLIFMAIKSSNKDKITLGEIYGFVKDNFSYYRHNDNGWKNSIRHNLTQHSCFKKVQRNDQHPGKGGFWQLSNDYATMFQDGIFKRKRRKIPPSQQGYMHQHAAKHTGRPAGKPAPSSSTKAKKKAKSKSKAKSVFPVHDMFDGSMGMTEGIDWDAFIPDVPKDMPHMYGATITESPLEVSGSSDTSSTMMSALHNMDGGVGSTSSPISILPDINQNDGHRLDSPRCEEYTLDNINAAPFLEPEMNRLADELAPDLDGVDCRVDWTSGGLCVVGKTMHIEPVGMQGVRTAGVSEMALEGIVPDIERDYNHVTVSDLGDLGGIHLGPRFCEELDDLDKPMPVDWLS